MAVRTARRSPHPKLRRPKVVPAPRQSALRRTLTAALHELFPEARSVYLLAMSGVPSVFATESVSFRGPTVPVPEYEAGTVGAAAVAVGNKIAADLRAACRAKGKAVLDVLSEPVRRFRRAWVLYRAIALAEAVAYHAGDVPADEFRAADWAAVVSRFGERFRQGPSTDEIKARLRAAGLRI